MKILSKTATTLTCGMFLFAVSTSTLHAVTYRASATVSEGNNTGGNILGTRGFTTQAGVVANGAGSNTHDLEDFGRSDVLDFRGEASASVSSFDSLKAKSSGMLDNAFYDPNYTYSTSTGDSNGVPTSYVVDAQAEIDQVLSWGGAATNYTSTYIMLLTGTVTGTGSSSILVTLQHAGETEQTFRYFDLDGSYSIPIRSSAYVHGASPQNFRIKIETVYFFDMQALAANPNFEPGSDYGGSADFGNTLVFQGIDSRDNSTGELLSQGTITTDAGGAINIIAVPEPSSVVLALLALGGVGFAARRNRKSLK